MKIVLVGKKRFESFACFVRLDEKRWTIDEFGIAVETALFCNGKKIRLNYDSKLLISTHDFSRGAVSTPIPKPF